MSGISPLEVTMYSPFSSGMTAHLPFRSTQVKTFLRFSSLYVTIFSILVNLWDIPREQVWDTTTRLALSLPPKVRLVVNGTMDRKHKVSFALKVKREAFSVHPAFCCP